MEWNVVKSDYSKASLESIRYAHCNLLIVLYLGAQLSFKLV